MVSVTLAFLQFRKPSLNHFVIFAAKSGKMKQLIIATIFLAVSLTAAAQNNKVINHHITAEVNPATSEITVTDSLWLPDETPATFKLNAEFTPVSLTKGVKIKKINENAKAGDIGMDRDDAGGDLGLELSEWEIRGNASPVVIRYSGTIESAIKQSEENYQRGFAESPGIISDLGVYLAGSTWWVPVFENTTMTFSLTTILPESWKTVTQGKRTFDETTAGKHTDTWVCRHPQEEIFLIAAPFTEYSYKMNSGIDAMAFLRTPDEGLANKYLEVTEQYMDMYIGMLGEYPYSKFALVENFWETGYGMPSFTLLGEKIIRFPFILHSSYPHELLHNWWGNSVYVDFESGNWCEGITAYMADHLIKEGRGAGEEYRRETLQKFSNFVTPENDFPLKDFRSRYDGASESIGYGKALMMWHMLRRKIGDENFIAGMKRFYQDNKFKVASFDDMRKAVEAVSGVNLQSFFDQWVNRKGAPELAIKSVNTDMSGGMYRINLTLEQVQDYDAFNVDIPVHVATKNGVATFIFNMNRKQQEYQISVDAKPLQLVVDPQYDVFRILNPAEVPPTLSKIWASEENLVIIPSGASKTQQLIYEKFISKWQETDSDHFKVVMDSDLDELPENQTAWILGYENKFAGDIQHQLKAFGANIEGDSVKLGNNSHFKNGKSVVLTVAKPDDLTQQDIFIAFDNENAIDGLTRKLPHYGKYSFLAFNGDEPTNIDKGQWPVTQSPLVKTFDKTADIPSMVVPREPLARLKPVFSENRMMKTIKYLSSEQLKGRGLGTPELDDAAAYIAEQFAKAGLQPIDEDYFQEFQHAFHGKGNMDLKNVIGIIPGTDPKLKEEPVVVSAHYDHLGSGWPDVHKGDEGKIHPGADDNASGVAILTELAYSLGKTAKPRRTIVFLATTGEEAGLIGAKYFVEHSSEYFKGKIFANLNLDTDGSLFDTKLLVLNGNSAREWKFIFMGTDYTTGVASEVVDKPLDASDQVAFIENGIPAVQLFTGPTQNYHRPTDTWEKIDSKGLVKVATVAKEVVMYLAEREDPMTFQGEENTGEEQSQATRGTRKASTGSVPDFAYQGNGVKIGSVIPGSAGDKAGLQAGDIITEFDGDELSGLRQYSDLLKKHQPGDKVKLVIDRNGELKEIELVLGER